LIDCFLTSSEQCLQTIHPIGKMVPLRWADSRSLNCHREMRISRT